MPSDIQILHDQAGEIRLKVGLEDGTVWLSQAQMLGLFRCNASTLHQCVAQALTEGEAEAVMLKEGPQGPDQGGPGLSVFYRLELVIAVGLHMPTDEGVKFRLWAQGRLRDFMVKGFALDLVRLAQHPVEQRYFAELNSLAEDVLRKDQGTPGRFEASEPEALFVA